MSNDATRYNLNGILIRKNGSGRTELVATNGHILATVELSHEESPLPDGAEYIVPADAVKQFEQMARKSGFREIELTIENGSATACTPDAGSATFPLIEGTYPNVDQVKPGQSASEVADCDRCKPIGASAEYLAAAAKMAKEFCKGSSKNPAVKWTTFGPLHPMLFEATNPDIGTIEIVLMPMRI
jgi:DNA polymerase III sliding clamp (beta) subunit (PCNA family)